MKDKTAAIFLITCICVFTGLAISIPVNHLIVYEKTAWELDQIETYLALATKTHGIEERVKYLDGTLERLAPYSGNSQWWFPTEETNIDLTKELIADISKDVHDQLDVKEREHYFFIPHNELIVYLDSEIKTIRNAIDDYSTAMYWHPNVNAYWYFATPSLLLTFFFMIGFCVRVFD